MNAIAVMFHNAPRLGAFIASLLALYAMSACKTIEFAQVSVPEGLRTVAPELIALDEKGWRSGDNPPGFIGKFNIAGNYAGAVDRHVRRGHFTMQLSHLASGQNWRVSCPRIIAHQDIFSDRWQDASGEWHHANETPPVPCELIRHDGVVGAVMISNYDWILGRDTLHIDAVVNTGDEMLIVETIHDPEFTQFIRGYRVRTDDEHIAQMDFGGQATGIGGQTTVRFKDGLSPERECAALAGMLTAAFQVAVDEEDD